MNLDHEKIDQLAEELLKAEEQGETIKPFSERFSMFTTKDGYAIQRSITELKLAEGHRIVGKKIGFTSEKLRQQFNVDEPDYGIITHKAVMMEQEPLVMSELISPKIEAEIAFILKDDLNKPDVTVADVIGATAGIMPSLEIVDSRFEDWRVTVADTIADNAANARIILGGVMRPLEAYDLRYIGLTIFQNGELIDSATGSAVSGNPVHAVVWLANKLYELGYPLKKGEIVMSGSFTPVHNLRVGDDVRAVFDRLGEVSVVCKGMQIAYGSTVHRGLS